MSEVLADFPEKVATAERSYIDAWRGAGRAGRELTGLALSGGGIRSAVFCLGVLQAFAKHNVLKNFDYLSTVSGGGYIGSSLTWFTQGRMSFGVETGSLPYGIDDPTQEPPRKPPGKPLLPHLRRHGSYLDPGGPLTLLPGVSVVLRGLILNLFVIWLPIATAICAILRGPYRAFAWGLPPWALPAIPAALFAAWAVFYSLQSGVQARRHKDMPYTTRREFERVTPYILMFLGSFIVLASLPYLRDTIHSTIASEGVLGFIMAAGGAALGLWSRLVPTSDAGGAPPTWAGPLGAALVIYGIGLLAYALSGLAYIDGRAAPRPWWLAGMIGFGLAAVVVGWLVNLNETTLHRFYRDRLMEAFMPDMGGDHKPVDGRACNADAGRLRDMCDPANPKGPYHLVCAHQVITRISKDGVSREWIDRWRIRGGDSFVFSPRYCGGGAAGWHETASNKAFSELSLPTAMAASGAAVNPNAASSGVGPQRNMLFAILMALLNIRLGIWIPNPNKWAHKPHAPAPNHFNAGFAAVFDWMSQKGRFLEITDGGAFENLAVYELLRRRVRTIVVCDAGADPSTAFADLQNLMSRAEADFGATISFPDPPLEAFIPLEVTGRFPIGVAFAKLPFVEADIRYQDGATGKLYYIKPSIFDGLRLHVLGFKGANPAFPDDSTINQFFDEARFEAYRELGFASVDKMLAKDEIRTALTAM
jgi:hypothetical protein